MPTDPIATAARDKLLTAKENWFFNRFIATLYNTGQRATTQSPETLTAGNPRTTLMYHACGLLHPNQLAILKHQSCHTHSRPARAIRIRCALHHELFFDSVAQIGNRLCLFRPCSRLFTFCHRLGAAVATVATTSPKATDSFFISYTSC